jgi:transcriptional regulator with XRE-family HTH domain
MTFGKRMGDTRKQKKMSQDELAKVIGTISVTVGRYERDEVKPSVEVASKIAEALEVSLDYLAGNSKVLLEKNIVKRITDIQQLPTDDKAHLFALMDAFLRDHKAKKAYAS